MLVGGFVLLCIAVAMLMISVALAIASVEGRFVGLLCFVFACAPPLALGAGLALVGLSRRKKADRLRDLEGLAFSRARLPLDLVARELGMTPAASRALIREALGTKVVEGRLDLEDDVFLRDRRRALRASLDALRDVRRLERHRARPRPRCGLSVLRRCATSRLRNVDGRGH